MRNRYNSSAPARVNHESSVHQPVENGRLKVIEICAVTMCQFTMESFDIIEESRRSIAPEVTLFIDSCLFKDTDCVTANNQASYCEHDFLGDCGYHACGGCLCWQQRFMRNKRGCRGTLMC